MTSFMTTTRRQAMCLCSSLRSSQRSFFSSLGGRRLRSMPRSSLITTANQAKPPPTPAPARERSASVIPNRCAAPTLTVIPSLSRNLSLPRTVLARARFLDSTPLRCVALGMTDRVLHSAALGMTKRPSTQCHSNLSGSVNDETIHPFDSYKTTRASPQHLYRCSLRSPWSAAHAPPPPLPAWTRPQGRVYVGYCARKEKRENSK